MRGGEKGRERRDVPLAHRGRKRGGSGFFPGECARGAKWAIAGCCVVVAQSFDGLRVRSVCARIGMVAEVMWGQHIRCQRCGRYVSEHADQPLGMRTRDAPLLVSHTPRSPPRHAWRPHCMFHMSAHASHPKFTKKGHPIVRSAQRALAQAATRAQHVITVVNL